MNVVLGPSGLVTAYGWGLDALWPGLMSNKTAIRPSPRFTARPFVADLAAEIPDLTVSPGESRVMAMTRALLAPLAGKLDPDTPLILATTVGEIEYVERAVENSTPPHDARPDVLLARLKQLLGLRGRAIVLSSACASSSAALARAASMVRHAQASSVLVVAADAVSEFVYSGFSTLLSLADLPARPFDARRAGLTLGEAAAWVLVTRDDNPAAAAWSAAVAGWGNTTDAYHMTAPDPAGTGLARAIAKACAMAQRSPADVAFIAAHGTATIYSDAMELAAFAAALGRQRPLFSVKGGLGHTLGAAGLVQILVAQHALAQGIVPPTVGMSHPDPAAAGWVRDQPTRIDQGGLALSTNSGFGGVNTAILLQGRTHQ